MSTIETFQQRVRKDAGANAQKYASEVQDLLRRFRDDCEIIDADHANFSKCGERDLYWNARLRLENVAKWLDLLARRLH